MRKWTAAGGRATWGQRYPSVRYSDAGTALPAAIPTVPAPCILYRYQGASGRAGGASWG